MSPITKIRETINPINWYIPRMAWHVLKFILLSSYKCGLGVVPGRGYSRLLANNAVCTFVTI